jgi:murein DD-endopeptidase MepM/ murein hydrolase activator NlpD
MTRLRRRGPRDEVLAPWLAAAVILGGWLLAARFVAPEPAAPAAGPPAMTVPGAAPNDLDRDDVAAAKSDVRDVHGDVATNDPGAEDPVTSGDVALLRSRHLLIPVAGVERGALASTFSDARGSGRVHEALDVLAPRGTPVVATEAGTIVKLFQSVRGGITIYQFDPTGSFCYYYAHLDAYAPGLSQGDLVERGDTIGYVGTTGNAPPQTPHLHFAIFRLGPERNWWEGTPIDPYLVLQ